MISCLRVVSLLLLGLLIPLFQLSSEPLAQDTFSKFVTYEEFVELAQKLSSKVSLFQHVWVRDAKAEFFGGTTRDYLYWLRGQFQGLASRDEALEKMRELEGASFIDARKFIIGSSDIDVLSENSELAELASIFGVRKVDPISKRRVEPGTPEAQSERDQGYIPVEKIRLGREGFIDWPGFGNGVREIYAGRPTVHFADPKTFAKTIWAVSGQNHRSFLALRFLRILAMNHFYLYGQGYPSEDLLKQIDPESARQTKEALDWALQDRQLGKLLKVDGFQKRMNALIAKAFRSHTNPTAAYLLYKEFGADLLLAKYGKQLDPINQYLFAQPPMDESVIAKNFKEFRSSPQEIFKTPSAAFPGLLFFHGVKSGEASFRAIQLSGFFPSADGSAGPGLYGVAESNKEDAIHWASSRDHVVEIPLNANARIIDTTEGPGKRLFKAFSKRFGEDYDAFARFFGAQIIKYDYRFPAFVVKDSAALGKPKGMTRNIMSVSEILEKAQDLNSSRSAIKLVKDLLQWGLTPKEFQLVYDSLLKPWLLDHPVKADSLKEVLDLLSIPVQNVLGSRDVEAFHSRLPFEEFVERFVDTKPSLEKIESIFLHSAILLMSRERIEFLKSKLLIPALKQGASEVSELRGIPEFAQRLTQYKARRTLWNSWTPFIVTSLGGPTVVKSRRVFESMEQEKALVTRLDMSIEQRKRIVDALAIPGLHDSKGILLRAALSRDLWTFDGFDHRPNLAETLLLALTTYSFLMPDLRFSRSKVLQREAWNGVARALEAIFGYDSEMQPNLEVSLTKQLADLAPLTIGHPELASGLVQLLEKASGWRRTSGLYYSRFSSIFASAAFAAAGLGIALDGRIELDLGIHSSLARIGLSAASFLLSGALLSRVKKYISVAKRPMAKLAVDFAAAAGVECPSRLKRLASTR